MPERDRHVLAGDLEWLEYAIADYVARWGEHFTGKPYLGEFGPNIAGLPTGVANMAMTVIRKNLVAQWTEPAPVSADEDPAPVVAGEPESTPAAEEQHNWLCDVPNAGACFQTTCCCTCHAADPAGSAPESGARS